MGVLNTDDPTIDVGQAIKIAYTPRASELIEPKPTDVVLCSHPDTMDGCAAAWVVYKVAKRDKIAVEFVNTGTAKLWTPASKDILDRNWIAICDEGVPMSIGAKTQLSFLRSSVGLVKPPVPYRSWKRTPPFGLDGIALVGKTCGVQDESKSLCRLVWEFFLAERVGFDKPPRMLSHIDDYVTGTHRYDDSRDIAAAVSSYPKELAIYDKLALACEDRRRREAMIAAGQGINRWIANQKS